MRNVLVRENSQGGLEVDFDPEVGFSVVEDPLDDINSEVEEDGAGAARILAQETLRTAVAAPQ